jgi:lipid-binding SYLF domain-containing protein
MAKNSAETTRASMGETKDQTRFRELVRESSDAYGSIAKGPHGEVPSGVLKNALCIGVIPSVMTGAFVVGGTHGEGLVSCKTKENVWSEPATISINQGSIGLQAGAKSADVVLFFQTTKAVDALKKGNFSFGADVSAVAGTYDSGVNTTDAGVLVYTRSEGLFAGASVNGSKVGKEQDMLERYYGEKIDYAALLDGRKRPDSMGYTKSLTNLFPQG